MHAVALKVIGPTMKHLTWFALCGLLTAPVGANPLKREPNERAQREADNPMRIIIEAATVKRGTRTNETAASPPSPNRPKSPPASSEPPAPPVTVITAPSKARSKPPPQKEELPPASLPEPGPPQEAAASSPKVNPDNPSTPPQAETSAPSNDRERQAPVLRLLSKVNPVVPERVQRQILKDTEVTVRLGIDPDGFVYRVEVLSDVLAGLEQPIQNALRRWRFEPMKDRASATVVLIFRAEE